MFGWYLTRICTIWQEKYFFGSFVGRKLNKDSVTVVEHKWHTLKVLIILCEKKTTRGCMLCTTDEDCGSQTAEKLVVVRKLVFCEQLSVTIVTTSHWSNQFSKKILKIKTEKKYKFTFYTMYVHLNFGKHYERINQFRINLNFHRLFLIIVIEMWQFGVFISPFGV